MNGIDAIQPIGGQVQAASPVTGVGLSASTPLAGSAGQIASDFSSILGKGMADMEARLAHANQLVRAYALDENVPVHQVTIALEEARIALELGLQVRTRLVEAYRDLMNTQL